MKVIYLLSMAQFNFFCAVHADVSAVEFDGTVSDRIAGLTNCHLETIFCLFVHPISYISNTLA